MTSRGEGAAGGGPDRERIDRNLALIQRVAMVGALLGAISNLTTGGGIGAVVLVGMFVLVLASAWMLGRGWSRPSAALLLVAMLGGIHLLAALGEGIRDTAIALYPVLVLAAALLLDQALLVATTLASVVSVAMLAWGGRGEESVSTLVRATMDLSIIAVVTAIGVYRLVADVARGAAEARAHEDRLGRAYRELERFTYVVSHDLKSPLVTIRGFLEYVEKDAASGDRQRLEADMQRIRSATDRMGRLLDDLLELSRTGRLERSNEPLRFGDVVKDALSLVEGRLAERGVKVEVQESAAEATVTGDRPRLGGLLQNLLDNAAKFMGAQPDPRIVVGVRPSPDSRNPPVFFVQDNGMGVAPEHHERIFDVFHRLDPRGEGTGIGLALARRIVEIHGGRLWIESEGTGRGAAFLFTLPGRTRDSSPG